MFLDALQTKSITTSGAGAQYPTGAISNGGAAVDEFDLGLLLGTEPLYFYINVTAVTGTDTPTFTPVLQSDDNVAFSSATTVWTANAAITATGLTVFKMPKVRERYMRLSTGTVGGTNPVFTFTCGLTTQPPSGRL